MHIAVLMTCFNRRDLTIASLQRLQAQCALPGHDIQVFLVDDGSQDGTADAVQRLFPEVHLLRGDGSLFWNGGMRKAFAEAMSQGFDGYIWFNDDTLLYADALERLLQTAQDCERIQGATIVVGSVQDAKTGLRSYGGFKRRAHGFHLDFDPVNPEEGSVVPCDTMNGNLTLIPAAVAETVGNLDARFRHQYGDWDYGLRAKQRSIPIVLAPGYFGTCSDNPRKGTWRDRSLPLSVRWRNLRSPKGAPFGEWFLYTRRHFGWRWPLYALSPYVKVLLGA